MYLIILSNICIADEIKQCEINRVIDGDTLVVKCQDENFLRRLRLYCIDAPEVSQHPYSDIGYNELSKFSDITVRLKKKDIYNRDVSEIFNDQLNINQYLVGIGAVAVYSGLCPKYNRRYYLLENYAKSRKLGIWEIPGLHQTPWEYRKLKRLK